MRKRKFALDVINPEPAPPFDPYEEHEPRTSLGPGSPYQSEEDAERAFHERLDVNAKILEEVYRERFQAFQTRRMETETKTKSEVPNCMIITAVLILFCVLGAIVLYCICH